MTKPLRVLFFYTALLILLVIFASAQTIRTELTENTTYTETGTAVYLDDNTGTFTAAKPLSDYPNSADGY